MTQWGRLVGACLFVGAACGRPEVAGSPPRGSTTDAGTDGAVLDAAGDPAPIDVPGCGAGTEEAARTMTPPSYAPLARDSCGSTARVNLLAAVADSVSASVADGAHVYFATENLACVALGNCPNPGGLIYRVPSCGGPPEALTTTPKHYAELVDAGDLVYYLTNHQYVDQDDLQQNAPTEVGRIDKATGVLEVLDAFPAGTYGKLAANGSHAYLLRGNAIHRVAHHATTVEQVGTASPLMPCAELDSYARGTAIAVDDQVLVWAAGRRAYRAALDGANAKELFTAELPIGAVALAGSDTYVGTWARLGCTVGVEGEGQLLRVRDDGSVDTVATETSPSAVAVVGPHVYWSDGLGLARVALDGSGSVERIASDSSARPPPPAGDRAFAGPRAWRTTPLPTPEAPPAPGAPSWRIGAVGARIEAAAADPQGDVLFVASVAGQSGTVGSASLAGPGQLSTPAVAMWLVKVAPEGTTRWAQPLSLAIVDRLTPAITSRLVVTPDGSAIVAHNRGAAGKVTLLFASDGTQRWSRDDTYPVAGPWAGASQGAGWWYVAGGELVKIAADGTQGAGVRVASDEEALLATPERALVRTSPTSWQLDRGTLWSLDANGSRGWEIPYSGIWIARAGAAPDGAAILLGTTDGAPMTVGGHCDVGPTPGVRTGVLLRISAGGAVEWVRWLPGKTYMPALAADPSTGAMYLSAEGIASLGPSETGDGEVLGPFLAKLDRDGRHVWSVRQMVTPDQLAVASGGPLVVTGDATFAYAP